ncbi:MAG TPA: hypothetical protein VGZ00_05810 [Candidatus Baltobacteraceae bacterium]|jgi:NAD(P)H-dependent flavin oxidoreductase YrpB (nitropropane dioxygenase family)|nr:hypothetical protein [Candidatus Baltobacteraceae bacterium]
MRTRFTGRFGVIIPIVRVPMTPHAGGLLAGAVSWAGAFGDPVPYIERFHDAGIQVAERLQAYALAEAVEDAKINLKEAS